MTTENYKNKVDRFKEIDAKEAWKLPTVNLFCKTRRGNIYSVRDFDDYYVTIVQATRTNAICDCKDILRKVNRDNVVFMVQK